MNYHRIFSKFYEIAAQKMCLDCRDFIEKGSKILDLGCGSGIVAKTFQDFFGAEILGADIEDSRTLPIPFKIIDGNSLPFENLSFDVVLISYVLHHSRDPEALLKEAKRVSEKIIIYEDLPEGILSRLRCNFHQASYNLFFQKQKLLHNLTAPQKLFHNFKTQKEWEELFKKLGLKIIAKKKVSLWVDWLDPVQRILFVLESI